jgi:glycopeptide antibiotics resistance protein
MNLHYNNTLDSNKKRLVALALAAYCVFLIRVVIFKISRISLGHFRFSFSQNIGHANFLPFKTILSYFQGDYGWLIAIFNLAGNIVLFLPIGLLIPLIYRKMTWRQAIILAVTIGLLVECIEVIFHVGIFDIDDTILNGLGIVTGYWLFTCFPKRNSTKFIN